jgi:putative transposase
MGSGKGNRHSIRLPEYDYSQPGAYHVTICVNHREERLGWINDGEMILNELGRVAHAGWGWLAKTFPIAAVDVFCIMPNHVHVMIRIKCRGVLQNAPTDNVLRPKPLGRLVGAYKTHTTVEINKVLNTPGDKFWQRNYYERAIRNENEYEAVWSYIEDNPLNWKQDENYST